MQRKLTPIGKKIKKKLIDKGITQAEFCRLHGIPESWFCDMIHTERFPRIRERVCETLNIKSA